MKTILLVMLWMTMGINILVYDWTSRHDLTVKDAVIVGGCGAVLGPFAVLPVLITSGHKGPVLINRRGVDHAENNI